MLLGILPLTLVAIGIAILKMLEQTWKICVFVVKILPIESQIEKRLRDLFTFIFFNH